MPKSIPLSPSPSSSYTPIFPNLGSRLLHRSSEVAIPRPNTTSSTGQYNRPSSLVHKLIPFAKRRNSTRPQAQAKLTQENLAAHHIRTSTTPNDEEEAAEKERNSLKEYTSPYYRGLLTNTSPLFHQDHIFVANSHGPTAPTTATTRSSVTSIVFAKIHEALQGTSSCFQFRSKKEDTSTKGPVPEPEMASAGLKNTAATNSTMTVVDRSSLSPGRVEVGSDSEKKPLRESFQSGPAADHDHVHVHDHQAVPLPLTMSMSDKEPKSATSQVVDELKESGQREFAWADNYRPKALEDFICNRSKAIHLQLLVASMKERNRECGHFIFEGPAGVGKRTMILAMLREAFGPDVIQASEQFKVFNLQGEVVGSIEVLVKESPRLVEINLSELKGYEKHVIFELIKETSQKISNKALPCKPPDDCRAIIFYEVDKLSTDGILYIKWLLERYKVCNKIFFCCSDVSKLQAIKNLCTVVTLLPPSKTEMVEVLKFIADKEGIELPHQLAEKISDTSKNNLRQAIRSFEATWLKHYPFTEDQEVLTGWEDDIAIIAKKMVQEQSPKLLYIMRGKLQNLKEHDLSPEFIFQSLVEEVKKHLNSELLKQRVNNLYVEFSRKDENIYESDKAVAQTRKNNIQQFLRIEEFIAKFMSCYKAEATKIMQQESDDQNMET